MAKSILKAKKDFKIKNETNIRKGEIFFRRLNCENSLGKYIFFDKKSEKYFYSDEINPYNIFIKNKEDN